MKITDIRLKTADQLNESVVDLKKEAFNLRFQKVTGELANTARIRQIRKSIAQMKTILNERKKVGEGNA